MTTAEQLLQNLKEMTIEDQPLKTSDEGTMFLWDSNFDNALDQLGWGIETIEIPSAQGKVCVLKETYTNFYAGLNLVNLEDKQFLEIILP